jgi:hypothetical protein
MGEVGHADDAEDEREADTDDRVEAAEQDAVDDQLNKNIHR